jgi:hypothetical protein
VYQEDLVGLQRRSMDQREIGGLIHDEKSDCVGIGDRVGDLEAPGIRHEHRLSACAHEVADEQPLPDLELAVWRTSR